MGHRRSRQRYGPYRIQLLNLTVLKKLAVRLSNLLGRYAILKVGCFGSGITLSSIASCANAASTIAIVVFLPLPQASNLPGKYLHDEQIYVKSIAYAPGWFSELEGAVHDLHTSYRSWEQSERRVPGK
jgi:hypothetical protein